MGFLPQLTTANDSDTRARLERWVCIGCGHVWDGQTIPRHCRQCGVKGGYAPEEIELQGTPSDALEELAPGVVVPDWSAALPHGLPLGRTMVLRGRPGAGKSRAGYRLASNMGTAMVLGIEMGKQLSRETARAAGAKLPDLWWYDEVDAALEDLEQLAPAVVVVDSIQLLKRARRRTVDHLRSWAEANQTNVIFISQLGTHGSSRHGEDDDFDCDMVCDIIAGKNKENRPSKFVHLSDEDETPCKAGHAHVRVAKSRVCPLLSFDVPIVAGH